MILDQRHITLEGRIIISHFRFTPPLVASSELQGQGCFIFPIGARGTVVRQDGNTQVSSEQGVLMKCGTYINKWEGTLDDEPAEVVILRLFPETIADSLETKTLSQLKERLSAPVSAAVVDIDKLMQKYLESLFFYFDHPDLVTDELARLKLKELLLLLTGIQQPHVVFDVLSQLFDTDKFGLQEIVEANLFEDLSLEELAALANMGLSTFKRKFKDLVGQSPGQYIREKRLDTGAQLLRTTTKSVSEIAYEVGFSDPNYFSKAFRAMYGKAPMGYRE